MTEQACPLCAGSGEPLVEAAHPANETPALVGSCPACGGRGSLTDKELIEAYQRTDGEPGNREADALADEIDRRGLDL